ncbi:MAG: UDP-N-acetylmuramate dehydrogenase, partial [Acidimicrobiales bacterium]
MSALDELVSVGGVRVREHEPIGPRTTYRVGGSARLFVSLTTLDDLDELGPLMQSTGLELLSIGNGSNLLINEGEHELLAVHLEGELAQLAWHDDGARVVVVAGAGLDLPVAARRLAREGVVGFEWAVGVPGTLGGAVAMNAGGHGDDLAGSIECADVWREGATTTWSKDRLELGYRTSAIAAGDIVVNASLSLRRGDAAEATARVQEIVRWRREHQPGGPNAGSVFRNPPGDFAARLIEAAGCKGLRLRSAQVSEKHANFIQADPNGLASDVFDLMNLVKERVYVHANVELVAE